MCELVQSTFYDYDKTVYLMIPQVKDLPISKNEKAFSNVGHFWQGLSLIFIYIRGEGILVNG